MVERPIDEDLIASHNARRREALDEEYEALGRMLFRRGREIEVVTERVARFGVAIPSWGVGTGGTRFARFPGPGEPRDLYEKLEDAAVVQQLVRVTPLVSLHIPWDTPDDPAAVKAFAAERGLVFDSMNSNTFQDQPGQAHSYKFGSLTHVDEGVRRQAIEHNLECLALGQKLGARAHTVWIGDGGNFPGQVHFRKSLERYVDSLQAIYRRVPEGWRLFIEHKLYEPAFYSTVLNDWGTSYWAVCQLGPKAFSLVDLGHHAPNVNIEMIVARLIQFGKLGGFHFNDSKYGDDDLDSGSIKPFQLFLIFNELVDAELSQIAGFDPCYMLDQSHNVTDPIESLLTSAVELVRAYVQAHLVDREELAHCQQRNDALMALETLKRAFRTDVSPLLAVARERSGGALDPVAAFRASGYRAAKDKERPAQGRRGGGGIV
jgi:L-rhamnose isomerase/sugar isomerase